MKAGVEVPELEPETPEGEAELKAREYKRFVAFMQQNTRNG